MINKMIEEMKLFKETQLVLDHKKDYKLCKNKSNYACAYYDCGKCIADEMIKIAEKYKAQEQCFELIKWERDCAISQLEELGTSLGEKPEITIKNIQEKSVKQFAKWLYDRNYITKGAYNEYLLTEEYFLPKDVDFKDDNLSNKQWTKILAKEFNISNTVAKEMLHNMLQVKERDTRRKSWDYER